MDQLDGRAGIERAIGTDLGASSWRRVEQAAVDQFTGATGDDDWRHQDGDPARSGPFGGPVVHTYLALPLMLLQLRELVAISGVSESYNYGVDRLRFPSLISVGSEVRTVARLTSAEAIPSGMQLVIDAALEIKDRPKPGCVASVLHRVID